VLWWHRHSNVTDHHRGPNFRSKSFGLVTERRHDNGRAMCHQSYFCLLDIVIYCNGLHIFHCEEWYCRLSVLCMYSMFGHHPHPLDYLCVKFCFFRTLYCWVSPWRKTAYSITHYHSLTLFDVPGTEAFALELLVTL